jgi:hypothetical protein
MNELLDAILDTLIPPSADGRMPGAGSLGLADAVRAQTQGAGELVSAGLAAVEAAGFADLDLEDRVGVLRELESTQPAFVLTLYLPACAAYYQHPKVLVGLGLEPRPPHPKGYELEPGNLATLERVRKRGKLYRDVS